MEEEYFFSTTFGLYEAEALVIDPPSDNSCLIRHLYTKRRVFCFNRSRNDENHLRSQRTPQHRTIANQPHQIHHPFAHHRSVCGRGYAVLTLRHNAVQKRE